MAEKPKDNDNIEPVETPRRGPLGDVLPNDADPDPRTPGSDPPEEVEDRPNVGSVRPEDYPLQERNKGK